MSPWLEWPIRILAGQAALVLFYLAWLVYEDEERRIQSRLEDWWLEIEEAAFTSRSRSAALFRLILSKLEMLLNKILGPRLVSLQSLSGAGCLWLLSAGLLLSTMMEPTAGIRLLGPVGIAGLLALGAFGPRTAVIVVGLGAPIVFALFSMLMDLAINHPEMDVTDAIILLISFVVSIGTAQWVGTSVLLLFLIVARRMLGVGQSPRGPAGVIAVALVLPVSLTWLTWLIYAWAESFPSGMFPSGWGLFALLVAAGFIAATCLPLVAFVVASAMVIHRMFWPSMGRVLYPLHRHRIIEQKKLINAVALALLGVAVLPWETVREKLADLLL